MTIGTADIALLDLSFDGLKGKTLTDQIADVSTFGFIIPVIKFQNNWIIDPAVDAA